MSVSTRRTLVRATAIGVQWLFLVIALGSLVIRSDRAFDDVISPHFGSVPMVIGAIVAGFLLGLTIESPKVLGPLVVLLILCAACFIGVINYAPVVDGVLMRTTGLDNYVTQRVVIVTLILILGTAPGAIAGNLLGTLLNVRQEMMPDPQAVAEMEEVPWWERRERPGDQHHSP